MSAFVGALLNFRGTGAKMSAIRFVDGCLNGLENVALKTTNSFLRIVATLFATTLILSSLLVLSVLMYAAFYNTYVPYVAREVPVNLEFSTGPSGRQGEMWAQLSLRGKPLQLGQPYDIYLVLEMPESPKNKELGMFMVCAELYSKRDSVDKSCRSTMLRYKSPLFEFLHTIAFSAFHLFGATEEKQTVEVHLFDDYREEFEKTTDVELEVKSADVEIYSAKMVVRADIYGLKYYMFHYPVASAAIGIFFNLLVIVGACMATWYQLLKSDEYREYKESKVRCESDQEGSSGSSSIENITGMEEYETRARLRRRLSNDASS